MFYHNYQHEFVLSSLNFTSVFDEYWI